MQQSATAPDGAIKVCKTKARACKPLYEHRPAVWAGQEKHAMGQLRVQEWWLRDRLNSSQK
jgi:hypothetical protein